MKPPHVKTLILQTIALSLLFAIQSVKGQTLDATFSTTEVSYYNGDIRLAASLLIPSGPGPFPGLVIVHGSGSSDRSNSWTSAYAESLVNRGIAVLYPDKRGSGQSDGDWLEASFSVLADDTLSGLEILRGHASVDPVKVGLIGFSQGGHIVPLAASRSLDLAFVINVSGSVAPILEQIGDETRLMGLREGLSVEAIELLQSVHEQAMNFALSGEDWEAYRRLLTEARTGLLSGSQVIAGFPSESDNPAWGFLNAIGDYDPLPYWRDLDIPALFLYGAKDENVDVFKSLDIIGSAFRASNLRYDILLSGEDGHALIREDAMDFIEQWIQNRQ